MEASNFFVPEPARETIMFYLATVIQKHPRLSRVLLPGRSRMCRILEKPGSSGLHWDLVHPGPIGAMSHVEFAPRGTEHHRRRFERTPTATARPHHHCAGPSARYLNILKYAELILKSLGCFFSHLLTFLDPLNVFCHRNRESDGNRVKHRRSQRGLCSVCHEDPRRLPQYVDFADFALPRQAQDSQKASVVFQYTVVNSSPK